MCKRLILNAGIEQVIIRQDENSHFTIRTEDWIEQDDSLSEDITKGY
jgi:dCMP deaminase